MRDGRDGKNGRDGKRGLTGAPGPIGPMPKHEVDGSKIRFQKVNGLWGEWMDLKGPQGEGIKGDKGDRGEIGKAGPRGPKGEQGPPGKDGKDGKQGPAGKDGKNGEDGLSAYEVWLNDGHTGTEDDFFNWLAAKVKDKVEKTGSFGAGSLKIKLGMLTDVNTSGAVTGNFLKYDGAKWVPGAGGGGADTASFGITVDGGGSVVTTGSKGFVTIPYACTITNWYIVANVSGSAVIDIKRSGTSIIGAGNKPTLSSAQSANAAATSWTSVSVSAGDILEFNVDSASAVAFLNLVVSVSKL